MISSPYFWRYAFLSFAAVVLVVVLVFGVTHVKFDCAVESDRRPDGSLIHPDGVAWYGEKTLLGECS